MSLTFNRWEVCLGYWHYANDFYGTHEALDIHRRLKAINYKPARSEEYYSALLSDDHELAREVYERLGGELDWGDEL